MRFVPQGKLPLPPQSGCGSQVRTSALPSVAGAAFRRNGGEILRNVKIAVWGLHNADAHIGVFRVEDVATVIVLESRLVHEGFFRFPDCLVDGNVLRQSTPVNSGGIDSDERAAALLVKMAEVAMLEHVSGMRPGHFRQLLVPSEGLRPAVRFVRIRGIPAVSVDERQHLLFKV